MSTNGSLTRLLAATNSLGVVTGQPPLATSLPQMVSAISSIAFAIPSSAIPGGVISSVLGRPSPVQFSGLSSIVGPASSAIPGVASRPSTLSTSTTPTNPASSATSAPSTGGSSGPSAGLIAGAVIGSVAVLALIGIFTLLLLRHRKKTSNKSKPAETIPEHVAGGEKYVVHDGGMMYKPEMETHANAWELPAQGPGHQGGTGPYEMPGTTPQYPQHGGKGLPSELPR
ncbi:hypothetical protein CC86DRAFT_378466 [Ophiobolus disseminans]|uniref:Mid2 domain-containing protein n=1 Tax=Ophiobolus disseminans TaxID=1469910 RepID=A0A6A7AED2_9PLEO|nr:hypothetical protein CC86DRAFT_378466 [Ophiobolus disseminans]